MPNHTPGPWAIDRHGEWERVWSVDLSIFGQPGPPPCPRGSAGPYGRTVCRVYGEGIASKIVGERDANANLIAAAPELLAACEALLDQLEGMGIPDWHGAEGLDLDTMRAAVYKARGE